MGSTQRRVAAMKILIPHIQPGHNKTKIFSSAPSFQFQIIILQSLTFFHTTVYSEHLEDVSETSPCLLSVFGGANEA